MVKVKICLFNLSVALGFSLLFLLPVYGQEDTAISQQPIRVEFKLAYEEPRPDCSKVIIDKTKEELFVDNNSCLSVDDIAYADVKISAPPESFRWLEKYNMRLSPAISLELKFTDKGRDKLAKITSKNIGRRLGVFVDGELLTAPKISQPILGGSVAITGPSTEQEARFIAERINKLKELYEEDYRMREKDSTFIVGLDEIAIISNIWNKESLKNWNIKIKILAIKKNLMQVHITSNTFLEADYDEIKFIKTGEAVKITQGEEVASEIKLDGILNNTAVFSLKVQSALPAPQLSKDFKIEIR